MQLALSDIRQSIPQVNWKSLGIPALVLLIIAMLILPLPTFLLDILFTLNIMIGLIVIMIAIHTEKPLDFSSFPAVLLFATMLRLSLNVASTRIVLVNGHEGTDAAGKVIEAFGKFVISGNYLVGFIIFGILMIINFIVVTKGAGRVSEVIARFTLDAMPGKQMAIDADLNSGVIDQDEAKQRRAEIAQESDFFGSMDGASKFVRGDAVAGLLILIINIIGGLTIGMTQYDMSFTEAGEIYVLLTIGDGLVAQIPSLVLSLATAIIVTRVTTSESMTDQTTTQLANPSALFIAAGILSLLGIIPGMPSTVFIMIAVICAGIGFLVMRSDPGSEISAEEALVEREAQSNEEQEINWDDVSQVDLVSLEIGYGLIPLVNTETGGQLLTRVKGVRKKLSTELGFLVQPIRIRDNLDLEPNTYHLMVNGVVRGRGESYAGKELAINPGHVSTPLEGISTKEPAFGLDAYWIEPSQRDHARTLGYTVVDAPTAIATHLNSILYQAAPELLGHDEAQQLLDKTAERSPKLIENLVPNKLSLASLTRVLQNLLRDGVPIRDMRTILEVLNEEGAKIQDPDELTALVRPKLGRMIVQSLVEMTEEMPVMTLDPQLEQILHNAVQQSHQTKTLTIDPELAENLFKSMRHESQKIEEQGKPAILVVSPAIRPWLANLARPRIPDITVLSYTEIPEDQAVNVVATVTAEIGQQA
ncbi:MAG: flagellar biosynthesis protein FlhA [Litorivicinaceae bacterium]|nr:flagellar biosynthesis protein FlhA [Gammaproteobacteria bacterium]RPG21214.1 MAG: flagellar biosynthesis protein FlhA [Oceanospirillales bacterium TMED33]RZO77872.1 MAG: flagellar biosynthesis protein FlhA [Litorivicinaceae bacterium]